MPYEACIDAVQILRSTLSLLEQSQYPEKDSPSIQFVIEALRDTIAVLEAGKFPPAKEEPTEFVARAASARTRAD